MFSSLPGPGAITFIAALFAAIMLTILGVALKLAGALILSWWWILSPVPVVLVLSLLLVGICSIFE